jgi:hypothetical protein
MGVEQAVGVLESHGLVCRVAGGWVDVLEVWTVCSVRHEGWVVCPRTLAALLVWLGY